MFDRPVAEKFQIVLMSWYRRYSICLANRLAHTCPGVQVPGSAGVASHTCPDVHVPWKTARQHIYFFETFCYFLCLTL
jgi:hypothetical protein